MSTNTPSPQVKGPAGNDWKRRLLFAAPVSAALAFTVFFFGPLDLFFNNYEELWFHLSDIIGRVVITALIVFAVCTLIGVLLKNTRLHRIYMALLFGGLLGAYVQGSFMNKNYGTLDGTKVDWGAYTGYGVVNTLVWLVCLLLPLVLMYFLREKRMRPVMIFLSLALILMQAASLVVSRINYPTPAESVTLTTDGMFDLSREENTLVFIVDTVDERYFQEMMENHPEYKEELTGFTSYTDALAGGARTPVALPLITTGIPRTEPGTYDDYIKDIWSSTPVYEDLKKAGYEIRIFTEGRFVGETVQDKVDNLEMSASSVSNHRGLNRKLYKLTLYKYAPHFLKWRFWMYTGDFDKFKDERQFKIDDAKLYKKFKKNDGFTYTDQGKVFRFYHLMGSHHRFTLKKDGTRSKKETSLKEQTVGCFHILFDMLDDLRENGVYDKANIIITADHGDKDLAQWGACLYKPAGDTEPYRESDAPVSFLDIPATLDQIAGGDYQSVGSGQTLGEAKEGERKRTFYRNSGTNATFVTGQYETTDHASDVDHLKLIREYEITSPSTIPPYELGTELSFTIDDSSGNVYCTHGFRTVQANTTCLEGHNAQMVIPMKDPPKEGDLVVRMTYRDVPNPCHMDIEVNGEKVGEHDFKEDDFKESFDFRVPASALKKDTLTLDFIFPDNPESDEDKEPNQRTKTFRLTNMVINAEE